MMLSDVFCCVLFGLPSSIFDLFVDEGMVVKLVLMVVIAVFGLVALYRLKGGWIFLVLLFLVAVEVFVGLFLEVPV